MKSIFDDLPHFCPVCGEPQDFDVMRRTSFFNGFALYCPHCRHKYQFIPSHVTEDALFDHLDPIYTAP